MNNRDPIIQAYSYHANEYAGLDNAESCWGVLSKDLWPNLKINLSDRLVVDVGCGPGATLAYLAPLYKSTTQLVGVEPADDMRSLCRDMTKGYCNTRICNGRFEMLPFESGSVDYLYSVLAFHWVTKAELAVREIGRVLSPEGSADIFFVGRWNGREFINKTTPIFLKYMGADRLFASAQLRQKLTASAAMDLFKQEFSDNEVYIREKYTTYYDTLAGHWRWWIRIAGQMSCLSQPERSRCEEEVRHALAGMEGPSGIPYTVHLLHAIVRRQKNTRTSTQV